MNSGSSNTISSPIWSEVLSQYKDLNDKISTVSNIVSRVETKVDMGSETASKRQDKADECIADLYTQLNLLSQSGAVTTVKISQTWKVVLGTLTVLSIISIALNLFGVI